MHDERPEDIGVFDFDEFADHLLDQGAQVSPAQLHGCISGLLGAGASTEPEYGLDALEQTLSLHLHGEFADRVMQLYSFTALALGDEGFSFLPLLPDDEEDIALRTTALASWCDGFLAGFAYQVTAADSSASAMSQDAAEVLSDIAAMAQAVATEDESEDEAEDSFSELVEYLRVAVVNIFLDCSANTEAGMPPSGAGRPLH
jgi:yecA family protein